MDSKINRKRKTLEKPMCKYGESCYQKNPEHHKKFKHPSSKTDAVTATDVNDNFLSDAPKLPSENISDTDGEHEGSTSSCHDEIVVDEIKIEETVEDILEAMPKDFFDFWRLCSNLNKACPEDAFSGCGYHLVGVYDLLARKLPKDQKVDISCHWRYFYDPPEFQTVIKKEGKNLHHIGYFRDDPAKKPSVLASNSAALGAKLTLMGDNIFAAMNAELKNIINSGKPKTLISKVKKMQKELQKFASQMKYSIEIQTAKTKERQQNVVAKTFNGFGIVVPVKNDVGYRTLPDSNATLKNILKKIVTAPSDAKKLEYEELLDEIMTNIHFANDECDYGTGLELGIDLFCFGDKYFHNYILSLLPLAYSLLQRPKYASIIKAHLKHRKQGSDLSTLGV